VRRQNSYDTDQIPKKIIEVAISLDGINAAAAVLAVIIAQMVNVLATSRVCSV
jgi:hypothetical protein